MKLASLKYGGRDGTLVVVDRTITRAVRVPGIAENLRTALEHWGQVRPQLEAVYRTFDGAEPDASFAIVPADLASPLPRSFQFLDGSVYLSHMEKARAARGAAMPLNHTSEPLIYQGMSDKFYGPCDPVALPEEAHGIDLEAEIAIIVDDVPMGVDAANAANHIQLVMLLNDWSLRVLTAHELPRGFGFLQSKPASSCSPVAVSVDELGAAWDGRKLSLPLTSSINGELLGQPHAGRDMYFDYAQLIAHAARTRSLTAGTIIGAGTVSNRDAGVGYGCLAEARTDQTLACDASPRSFLRFGDVVRIEMLDNEGQSIFGAIESKIIPA